jgi:methionine-rich copper-binding protein CopC
MHGSRRGRNTRGRIPESPLRVRHLVVACLLALAPSYATGHAILRDSSPPHDAILSSSPEKIVLRFTSRIEPRLTRVTLTDGQGRRIPLSPSATVSTAPDEVSTLLPPLPAGTYIVRFRVLATDGHVTEGVIRFTVESARGKP